MPSPSRSVEYDILNSFSSTSDNEESSVLINDETSVRNLFDNTYDTKPRINQRKMCISLALSLAVLITVAHRRQNKVNDFTAPRKFVGSRPYESATSPLAPDTRTSEKPSIAWLMSYPNSGTSYTMRLVQTASNTTAATNYGEECDIDTHTGRIAPLYDDSPSGPYLRHVDTKPVPEKFIITKTHCGGRCVHCPPSKYIESIDSFYARCLTGTLIEPTGGTEVSKSRVQYSDGRVKKAIHLVRDPINNVVARFHLEYNNHKGLNNFSSSFPNNKQGFRDWCIDLDNRYTRQENRTDLISPRIKALFRSVPCHSEFYRYALWHNLAIEVTEKMSLDSAPLVLHYEDYERSFDPTLRNILRFLELDTVGKISPFIPGKTYHDYFQNDELVAAMDLIKATATKQTWTLVRRYEKVA